MNLSFMQTFKNAEIIDLLIWQPFAAIGRNLMHMHVHFASAPPDRNFGSRGYHSSSGEQLSDIPTAGMISPLLKTHKYSLFIFTILYHL